MVKHRRHATGTWGTWGATVADGKRYDIRGYSRVLPVVLPVQTRGRVLVACPLDLCVCVRDLVYFYVTTVCPSLWQCLSTIFENIFSAIRRDLQNILVQYRSICMCLCAWMSFWYVNRYVNMHEREINATHRLTGRMAPAYYVQLCGCVKVGWGRIISLYMLPRRETDSTCMCVHGNVYNAR